MSAESSQFSLKFGSDNNDINAATYGVVLVNTVTLIEEANNELNTGLSLEIKVKTERTGSFIVDLGINPSDLPALVTAENANHAKTVVASIISLVKGGLELKKALKGEPPKKAVEDGDSVTVTTSNNTNITIDKRVYNISFENQKSQTAMKSLFKTLNEDKAVKKFAVLGESGNEDFVAEREDFPALCANIAAPLAEIKIVSENAVLSLIKPSFEPNLVWEFWYRGEKKTGYVKDPEFLARVDSDARFGKGDALIVELDIEQKYDKIYNTYVNTGNITITKVLEHKPKPITPNLFDSEANIRIDN